jgi:hypothetical protein
MYKTATGDSSLHKVLRYIEYRAVSGVFGQNY